MPTNTQKLRVLRSRTDADLLVLVNRELERGINLLNMANSRNSPVFAQAVKAHQTATALLPRIAGLSDGDRLRIEAKVTELRSRLDRVPVYANVRLIRHPSHRNLHPPSAQHRSSLSEQADDELDNEANAHGAGSQQSRRAGAKEVHLPSSLLRFR
jgi:hypothetical protein